MIPSPGVNHRGRSKGANHRKRANQERSGPQSQQRGARLTLLSQLIESGCFAFRYMPYSERNRNAKQPNPVYTVEEEEEEEEEEELIKITRPGGAARLPLDEGD